MSEGFVAIFVSGIPAAMDFDGPFTDLGGSSIDFDGLSMDFVGPTMSLTNCSAVFVEGSDVGGTLGENLGTYKEK